MRLSKLRNCILLILLFGIIYACSTRGRVPDIRDVQAAQKAKIEQIAKQKEKEQKENEVPPPAEPQPEKTKVPEAEKRISVNLPEVNREFRAAWVASVANINWPSKRGLSTEQQKAEAVAILDNLKENHFNAVILQIRPSADALYDSPFEPWSIFLTGETGTAPKPYYDPLKFWIEEAHQRGLELHAWINPYRVHHSNGGKVNQFSMVNKMKNQVVKLKNGMYWFDPGKKEVQDHISQVILDIVRRYDVDGIHFDDYFYPYKSYNNGADFPDNDSWNAYKKSGGTLSRGDWRRDNVNKIIQRIYTEIKTEKSWVQFGLSPFGIWKPGFPSDVTGMSQYDELYADAKTWLNNGWIDYFSPQLYWADSAPKQSFTSLLRWWNSENTYKRHLWPGINTVEVKASDRPTEIVKQIGITRDLIPEDAGVIHWSYKGLDEKMLQALKNGPYKEKALTPKSSWMQPLISGMPKLELHNQKNEVTAEWIYGMKDKTVHWILYALYGENWEIQILDADISKIQLPKSKNGKTLNIIAIQAVDRLGNESEYNAKQVK